MPSVQNSNFSNQYLSQLDMPEQDHTLNQQKQLKCTSTENYLRSASNETNIAVMSNDRNFVKRGDLHGPTFELDHLATFSVGSKQGLLKAEDGMRKLRIMEKSQGIWTMECQIMIDSNYLVVLDKKTGQEVEKFPLTLVHDPVSVVSDDKKDIYNNIILFTVLDDSRKKNSSSEMHIFQCNKSHSAEIVDEIYKAKETSNSKRENGHGGQNYQKNLKLASNFGNTSGAQMSQSPLQRRATFTQNQNQQITPTKIEMEVQVLNHCFDDIERFVTRLQNSTEYYKELEKRQRHRKSHKKHLGDGMLGLRAQMPPPQHYIDIFQKFKYSFNLLAKLKAHIHDPNAPELVHFLFTPLSLIVNTTKEQPYRGLAKTVWSPLLTRDAKSLLLNCLTSKEQDLWLLLGDAWSVTLEDAQLHPEQYGHLENQIYNPVFSDGFASSYMDNNNNENFHNLALATASQVNAQSKSYIPEKVPVQKQRYYNNTQPFFEGRPQNQYDLGVQNNSAKYPNIRNYEAMKKWAVDLCYRGAKIYEVTHDRQANNEKELTIKVGELLEVLDDKRNWWRLRNFQGEIGHAPVTILRPYEFNNNNINFMASNANGGQYDAEKFNNKMVNLQLSQLSPETCSSSSSSFSSENNLTTNNNVTDKTQNNSSHNNSSSIISPTYNYNSNNLNSKTFLIKSLNNEDESRNNKSSFNYQEHTNANISTESSNFNSSDELSKNNVISSTQYSNSFMHSANTSSENNQTNSTNHKDLVTTPKASYIHNNSNTVSVAKNKIPEAPVITLQDQIKLNQKQFLRKSTEQRNFKISKAEIEPMKDKLHEEIVKRMSKKEMFVKKSFIKTDYVITSKSSSSEVKKFLESKEFSEKIILMFGELTGEEIFMLYKHDFESYCGREEGAHLDSQIRVQKSLCGWEAQSTNELDNILKKRKERSEMTKI